MVIADTGFWVALYNPRDADHRPAQEAALRWQGEGFITTHAVVAEACHLIRKLVHVDIMIGFVQALCDSEVAVHESSQDALERVVRLMKQYRDLPMDYADASLVLLAEHLRHGRILTTDRRDFGAYRWKRQYPFENLLDSRA